MKTIVLLILFVSSSTFAKTMNVTCDGKAGKSISMISSVYSIHSMPAITYLQVNGKEASYFRDDSALPFSKNGKITLKVVYGDNDSDLQLNLEKCHTAFEATGKAVMSERREGSKLATKTNLNCTCEVR